MHYDTTRRYGFTDLRPGDHSNSAIKSGRGRRRAPDNATPHSKTWKERIAEFFVGDEPQSRVMAGDAERTESACRFLASRRHSDPPFFMLLGLISPHFPLIAPQRFYDSVRDRVPMPDLPDDWFERLPTNYQQLIYGFGVDRDNREIVKLGRELYWALTGWMDAKIGEVLDTLAASDVAENTIVIYTSDHGENKGDHGMWWKNCMYDHSARIPIIARWPERWAGGQRRAGACSLVDLVQTICDIAGAEPPDDWDGDSMLPWLDDASTPWKDLAASEYYAHNAVKFVLQCIVTMARRAARPGSRGLN
jgi:choline-sulfatase